MTRLLPIALSQVPAQRDVAAFADTLRAQVRVHPEIELWVFPELHLSTPEGDEQPHQLAVTLGDDRLRALSELAAELKIWLVPGSIYEADGAGGVYNTALVFGPDGRRVAVYRKVFPWRPLEVSRPGTEFVVFDIPGRGRVGLSICYDSWFPELTRHLAWMGAELILCLVQTDTSDRQQEVVITQANAIVNQCWVASVNSAAPTGRGRSLLVDPEGRIRVASPSSETTVLTDVVDFDAVTTTRRYGTAAVSRPWSQFTTGDRVIELPLYAGTLDPARWTPATPIQEEIA